MDHFWIFFLKKLNLNYFKSKKTTGLLENDLGRTGPVRGEIFKRIYLGT